MTLPNRKLPMAESKLMNLELRLVEAVVAGETTTVEDATIMKTAKSKVKTMAIATNAEVVVVAAEVAVSKGQKTRRSRNKPGKSVSQSRLLPQKRPETTSKTVKLIVVDVVAAIANNATTMAKVLPVKMPALLPSTVTSASTTNTVKTRNREVAEEAVVAVVEAAKEVVIIKTARQMLMETKK